MKLTEEDFIELRQLAKKFSCVNAILEVYEYATSSPVYESYVAIKVMMANLNEDLKSDQITLLNVSTKEGGDDKSFLYAHKYATEIKFYHEQLEYLRLKMLPEQIAGAEAEVVSALDEARLNISKSKRREI